MEKIAEDFFLQLENLKQEILHPISPKPNTKHGMPQTASCLCLTQKRLAMPKKKWAAGNNYFIITTPFNCLGIRGPVAGL